MNMEYSKIIKTKDFNIDEVIQVWEKSVRATHHFLREEDLLFYKEMLQSEYFKDIDIYCIKNNDNCIVAFMTVSDQNIDALFINPPDRGKGLGKLLVGYAVDNMNVNSVEVNEQNSQAVGFYERQGFKIADRSETDEQGKPYPVLKMYLGVRV